MNYKKYILRQFVTSISTILVLTCQIALSQGPDDAIRILDNQIGFGARALGMGGTYTAVSDDYSAIYWNPAGLAQIRKSEFFLGFSHLYQSNEIDFNGSNTTSSTSATKFNSIGLVFPVPTYQGSLVFALGYQKIKDFEYSNEYDGVSDSGTAWLSFDGVDVNNPDDVYDFWGQDMAKTGLVTDDGSLEQWSLGGAIDVSPNISLGLALNYWTGKSEYLVEFNQFDQFDLFNPPADFSEYQETRYITSKYSSFNAKFGAMMRLGRIIRLGLGMDIPHTFTVSEDYGYDASLYFDNGDVSDFSDDATYEYKVKTPFRFQAGATLKLGTILATGSLAYTDWTQFKFTSSDLREMNKFFQTDYRGTLQVKLGGEIGIPFLASQFRAGLAYDPTPLKGYDFDYDRKYVSLGYGVLLDRIFKIDAAYMIGFWKLNTSDDLNPAGTVEDILIHKLLLNFSYRF
ncbi:MAG: outer membrane protein transport protein [bacterium]|nr:MAG: outer membrane protein transport protein [bacterium]